MPLIPKNMPFIGKKGPQAPRRPDHRTAPYLSISGFGAVPADEAFDRDEIKGQGWNQNTALPYIEAEGSLPFVDIPAKLAELAKHCWKFASRKAATQRGPIQIGVNQAANFPFNASGAIGRAAQHSGGPNGVDHYKKEIEPIFNGLSILREGDWGGMMHKFQRVNALTFRGDHGRSPMQVEADGGFHPPITRTDFAYVDGTICSEFRDYMKRRFGVEVSKEEFHRAYNQTAVSPQDRLTLKCYFGWRALVEKQSHHIDAHVRDQTMKNYVSTTTYAPVAKSFAGDHGWVYVTRVRGGFHVPTGKTNDWMKSRQEQEVALPGTLPWKDVVAFRKVSGKKFDGEIYLRQSFRIDNPTACQEVYEVMSGKVQS